MGKRVLIAILSFALTFCICGCTAGADVTSGSLSNAEPGDRAVFSSSGVSFGMRYVPGDIVFPMDFYDFGIMRITMEKPYWIAETEVSYELWKKVYDWAVSGKDKSEGAGAYSFIHTGRQGADNSSSGKPIGSKYHPVTNISWRDAIIWCNALTEWYNARTGSNLVCVYYTDEAFSKPIRAVDSADDYPSIVTPGTQDNPFVNPDADGFRLPSRDEWVLAALYQGDNDVNSEEDFPGPHFTKGNSASGATASFRNAEATGKVCWYNANSGGTTKAVGSAGTNGRKPLTGNANHLGIYDMSGNVVEFSFDWYRKGEMGFCYRTIHSGSWAGSAELQKANIRMNILPYDANNVTGFRFVKNK
ncbi:MAG: formylglycine-generating enzyme family protein [Ruminiclostridium sp.]|nr:formylglycine-generating enzyme family protein [Ruminiclostridium sp.]